MKKNARTISGVTPVAVMTLPLECPGRCVYCPAFADAPRSYTPESPAVLRARVAGYDPKEQIRLRLKVLAGMGHPADKIELIVMGGTFLAYPRDYQERFIKDCYDALNGADSADLAAAMRLNETAARRCTGLCIETRPDWCGPGEIQRMLDFGATRVELGVQTLDDGIYRLVRRGHTVADVARATRLLREHCLKVYYHWMPGLPGADPALDLSLSRMLFEDERFRPDGLKIYPTMVIAGTELERWHREGRYRPYGRDELVALVAGIKAAVPRYARIARVLRDIPTDYIEAGCRDSLRGLVKDYLARHGLECRCVRCREFGHRARLGYDIGEPRLARLDYEASGGKEIFLSFEDERETLFGLLRLRIQPLAAPVPGAAGSAALVRELHVFGPEVPLSEKRVGAAQHRGLGRALLQEAERIAAAEFGLDDIAVLSGAGARGYYREAGYELDGHYMVKRLQPALLAGRPF